VLGAHTASPLVTVGCENALTLTAGLAIVTALLWLGVRVNLAKR
jgi:hypothetical protein